ncbi:MAG TPA: MFS transporter [Burkholderiales bacterium]|nr:MFS transporter [Burkholderiales bacterium]
MTNSNTTPEAIAARIERLPLSPWHLKLRVIMGIALFFDAFDALAIAYVLPVLIGMWKLAPAQIGLLISAGFAGQLVGAIFFGWLAERIGRINGAVWTIGIFSVFSVVCALSWSFQSMLVFRFIQGLGLGGEVPIAAAYIGEIAKADKRGRFFLLYQVIFAVGLAGVAVAATWIVPNLGWQWMFYVGAVPAVIALILRRALPESPRWLASRGRLDDADRTMRAIEDEVSRGSGKTLPALPTNIPPISRERARFAELFSGSYARRTFAIWVMWFCSYLVTYGIAGWLPTVYRTVFKLPVQQALQYTMVTPVIGVVAALACAFFIDKTGRKAWFGAAFLLGSIPLFVLAAGAAGTPFNVMILSTASWFFITTISLGLYLYSSEIYPTRVRALGTGTGTAWVRLASIIGPFVVGMILPASGLGGVFLMFAIASLVGGVITLAFGIETRGRTLEELSP